jgi:hypothetical protein
VRSTAYALAGVMVILLGVNACKSAPSQKPIKMGPVDTGPGSLEYTRRQLEGTWTLERFETVDANGQAHPVPATATLNYDAYGNLKIIGQLQGSLPGTQANDLEPFLSYTGRITIDTAKHEFVLLGASGTADPTLMNIVGTQMVRRYEITPDRLTLTYVDPAGKTTARTVFRKGSQPSPSNAPM